MQCAGFRFSAAKQDVWFDQQKVGMINIVYFCAHTYEEGTGVLTCWNVVNMPSVCPSSV